MQNVIVKLLTFASLLILSNSSRLYAEVLPEEASPVLQEVDRIGQQKSQFHFTITGKAKLPANREGAGQPDNSEPELTPLEISIRTASSQIETTEENGQTIYKIDCPNEVSMVIRKSPDGNKFSEDTIATGNADSFQFENSEIILKNAEFEFSGMHLDSADVTIPIQIKTVKLGSPREATKQPFSPFGVGE